MAVCRWRGLRLRRGLQRSGYHLTYAAAGGSWRSINLGARTSYTLTGLRNGTKYYVYLVAVSSGGKSPAATTSGSARSSSATAVPPTAVSSGNRAVTLRWSQPTNTGGQTITKYVVQIGTNGVSRNLVTLPATTRGYTAGNLVNGRTYDFRVIAANQLGWGLWSTAVQSRAGRSNTTTATATPDRDV